MRVRRRRVAAACLIALLQAAAFSLSCAGAETLRIATFNTGLVREGPGLLLRDIRGGKDPQVHEVVRTIAAVSPDVILLTNFDHDLENVALAALADTLEKAGASYPYLFSRPPNAGLRTGIDLDGDGRTGTARDAQGYGRFPGQGGMALLSRLPVVAREAEDYSRLLWKNLPGARLPVVDGRPFPSPAAVDMQRLSSTGHWVVPLQLGNGQKLRILAFHATPPVFDGPEDRNGLRNADEIRFWRLYLDGRFGGTADRGAFVIVGDANIDPHDGPGRHEAIRGLLADPRVQDPKPVSIESRRLGRQQGGVNSDHRGNPGQDTADLPDDETGPGNLRLDYVLPSADLRVVGAGLSWPDVRRGENRTRHALVWVDIAR